MPPKARISKLKSKKSKEMQSKIGDIMNGILQTDRNSNDFSAIDVILNKYLQLRKLSNDFLENLLRLLTTVNDEHLNNQSSQYKRKIMSEYRSICKDFDTTPYETQLDIRQMPEPMLRTLRNKYLDLKESFLVLTSVMIAKNILSCKLDGKSLNKLERYDEFCDVAFSGDTELRIFNYIKIGERKTTIDFDFVTIFDESTISKRYDKDVKLNIFKLIVQLCETGRNIDRLNNEPDINVAEIFPKIIEMIDAFKGKMHGCERAFDIIKNSSHIFEKNCNKYIRKASKTTNPMCMFTDFIDDIIKVNSEKIGSSDGGGKAVIMELKRVIREMRQTIEQALRSTKEIPENIKFALDAAEIYIEEFENDTSGEIPDISEIRKRQQSFKDIFIP